MNTLKNPFIISVLFHSIALFYLAVFYQPAREAFMNVTPLEFIHLPQEEKGVQQRPKQTAASNKTKAVQPSQTEEKREEIKKEPEKVLEEQKTTPVSELPAPPQNASEAESAAAIDANAAEATGSKYGLEGGTGKGSGDELALFRTMVRAKIEKAKFYPRWARERGYEGVVGVHFTIQPDGNVIGIKVVRPCHCDILNKAACEAIKKASPFNPRPKDLEGKEMAMEIDISFRLE